MESWSWESRVTQKTSLYDDPLFLIWFKTWFLWTGLKVMKFWWWPFILIWRKKGKKEKGYEIEEKVWRLRGWNECGLGFGVKRVGEVRNAVRKKMRWWLSN
jgi:hypothetical protein